MPTHDWQLAEGSIEASDGREHHDQAHEADAKRKGEDLEEGIRPPLAGEELVGEKFEKDDVDERAAGQALQRANHRARDAFVEMNHFDAEPEIQMEFG